MHRIDEDGREQRLYGIVLEYLEAAERGEIVDRAALLALHPEFAVELQEFLEGGERLNRLMAPLRPAAPPGWPRPKPKSP